MTLFIQSQRVKNRCFVTTQRKNDLTISVELLITTGNFPLWPIRFQDFDKCKEVFGKKGRAMKSRPSPMTVEVRQWGALAEGLKSIFQFAGREIWQLDFPHQVWVMTRAEKRTVSRPSKQFEPVFHKLGQSTFPSGWNNGPFCPNFPICDYDLGFVT